MSDFLGNLLNRYMGINKKVLPRARARFEPDAAATFLLQYDQENSHNIGPEVDSPANDLSASTMDDHGSEKQPVNNQRGPLARSVATAEDEITRETKYDSSPESAYQPISEGVVDRDKKRVITNKRATRGSPPQESVQKCETGNALDDKVQNTPRRSLPLEKQRYSTRSKKRSNSIHVDTISTQESFHNQQSDQHLESVSKVSSVLPVNLPKPEASIKESQPGQTGWQNTDTGSQGLLAAPACLSQRESELCDGLFIKDPKTETDPVVNVTIGRIEVQATHFQSQEQPRRQKKPSGVMSLDKYLNQRSRGGNR